MPETKPVAGLLKEMQKAHVQLAMVIDEYGGVCGLVTVETITRRLLAKLKTKTSRAKSYRTSSKATTAVTKYLHQPEIGRIERLFDMEIEADDFTTIAGLVINESGTVPAVGETLMIRGLEVEVLEADKRRILRLRVRKAQPENATEVGHA